MHCLFIGQYYTEEYVTFLDAFLTRQTQYQQYIFKQENNFLLVVNISGHGLASFWQALLPTLSETTEFILSLNYHMLIQLDIEHNN